MSAFITEKAGSILNTRVLTVSEAPSIELQTLTTTALEMRLDKEDRKSLYIINDSSYFVYVGFTPTFTIGVDGITLFSGEALRINFLNDINVYAKLEEGTTDIRIIETQ